MAEGQGKKLSDLKVIELKEELEKRGLDNTGFKKDLIDRLARSLESEGENIETYDFMRVITEEDRLIEFSGKEQIEKKEEEDVGIRMILMEIRRLEEKRQKEKQQEEEKRQKEKQQEEEKRQQEEEKRQQERQEEEEKRKQERIEDNEKLEKIELMIENKLEVAIKQIEDSKLYMENKIEEMDRNMKQYEKTNEARLEKTEAELKRIDRNIISNSKNIQLLENQIEEGIQVNLGIAEEENKKLWKELKIEIKDVQNRLEENLNKEIRGNLEEENIKMKKELKEEIQDLKNKIEQGKGMGEHVACTGIKAIYGGVNHKFDGNIKRLHPKIFIRILKNKMRGIIDIEDMKEIIRDHLENHPLIWFAAREKEIENFNDFENLFIQYFWGENVQAVIRENLYFGKFLESKGSSLNNYAIYLHATTQYLEPPIPEEEIVMFIARHYKAEIAETIAVQNIRKIDQLCNYLSRVERNLHKVEMNNHNRIIQNYNNNKYNNNSYNRNNNNNQRSFNNTNSYRNDQETNNRVQREYESRNSEGDGNRRNEEYGTRRLNYQRIDEERNRNRGLTEKEKVRTKVKEKL